MSCWLQDNIGIISAEKCWQLQPKILLLLQSFSHLFRGLLPLLQNYSLTRFTLWVKEMSSFLSRKFLYKFSFVNVSDGTSFSSARNSTRKIRLVLRRKTKLNLKINQLEKLELVLSRLDMISLAKWHNFKSFSDFYDAISLFMQITPMIMILHKNMLNK